MLDTPQPPALVAGNALPWMPRVAVHPALQCAHTCRPRPPHAGAGTIHAQAGSLDRHWLLCKAFIEFPGRPASPRHLWTRRDPGVKGAKHMELWGLAAATVPLQGLRWFHSGHAGGWLTGAQPRGCPSRAGKAAG